MKMKIRANYEALNSKSIALRNEGEKLNDEVEKLLKILEEIKENWKGTDSEVFFGKAEAYFKNIKQISGSIDEFGWFAKYVSNSYETRDVRWKKEIEEAGVNFGDEELKRRNK